jgi:hypothetical protein
MHAVRSVSSRSQSDPALGNDVARIEQALKRAD